MRVAFVLLVAASFSAAAREPPASPEELAQFFDGVLAAQISSGDVVGATVAVVRDGRLWFAQGYGMSDRESGAPVDADGTLFRIGSVSKLFVWIAVMQQWQAGRLDLDADVNEYLDEFFVADTFPEPVTLTHLMTHTPGFEDRLVGLFAHGPRTMGDFHERLQSMMPARLWMPGKLAAYSNYGTALAAHVVERVSGLAWDDYVEMNILQPLDMHSTTSRQPVPKPLDGGVSRGYRFADGRWVEVPFEFVTLPPAGSVSATSMDMARLVIELLSDRDSLVLPRNARQKLFEPAFEHDPRLNGMLFGMHERNSHGRRIVGHNGDTNAFHSAFVLYPDQWMGLFVSYNSDRGATAREALVNAFEDRWFGRPEPAPRMESATGFDAYSGYFRNLRAPESDVAKLVGLLGAVRIGVDPEGYLTLPGPRGPRRFYAVEPDLFVEQDGPQRIAFRDSGGVKTHLFFDSAPMIAFERVTFWRNPLVHAVVIAAIVAIFSLALVKWPASTYRRRSSRVPVPGETRATIVASLQMLGVVVFLLAVSRVAGDNPNDVLYGVPAWFAAARWIPVGVGVLVLIQLRYCYRAWVESFWWLARRIHYTLTAVAGGLFVAWCAYWNLVPDRLPI